MRTPPFLLRRIDEVISIVKCCFVLRGEQNENKAEISEKLRNINKYAMKNNRNEEIGSSQKCNIYAKWNADMPIWHLPFF